MIEKLGTPEAKFLSNPCSHMVKHLEKMLNTNPRPLNIAEIGVGYGATSVEIVKQLRECDTFYFYSFQEEVDELYEDLKNLDVCKCKLVPMGNSHALYDSFCWNLGKQVIDHKEGLFDLVYLDGAHSFLYTGLATALLKQLIRQDGYIIFDDLNWSYGSSYDRNPEVYPEILEQYTQEQVDAKQIQMVVDAFMENDDQWTRTKLTDRRVVYQKKPKEKTSLLSKVFKR